MRAWPAAGSPGRRERLRHAPGGRVLDQRRQPPLPRLGLLGARDPVDGPLPPRRRPALEPLPRGRFGAQPRLMLGLELRLVALLVGVDRGAALVARLEGREAGGRHPPFRDQLAGAGDVDRAPDAAGAPRREADRVALVVDLPADAVDPAEAERLVHRFRPRDARPPAALLVEADEQLAGVVVMLLEPGAEVLRGREESGLHAG